MSEVEAVNIAEKPNIADFAPSFRRVQAEVHKAIIGHEVAVEELLSAFFASGHVLIEGVPGTGKTTLVKTLGLALNLSFNRVQFTVDLMPADITGTRVIFGGNEGRREFSFQPGPIFSDILLADEINRATPKTQSALLEAMAELQVTVGGTTYPCRRLTSSWRRSIRSRWKGPIRSPKRNSIASSSKSGLRYPGEDELVRIVSSTTGPEEVGIEPVFPLAEAASRVED